MTKSQKTRLESIAVSLRQLRGDLLDELNDPLERWKNPQAVENACSEIEAVDEAIENLFKLLRGIA